MTIEQPGEKRLSDEQVQEIALIIDPHSFLPIDPVDGDEWTAEMVMQGRDLALSKARRIIQALRASTPVGGEPVAWRIESKSTPGEAWEWIEGREPTEYLGYDDYIVRPVYYHAAPAHPVEPVAWLCERPKCVLHPKVFYSAEEAKRWSASITVNPPVKIRPLYAHPIEKEGVSEAERAKLEAIELLLQAKDVWEDYGSGFRIHFSFDAGTDIGVVERIHTARSLAHNSQEGGE